MSSTFSIARSFCFGVMGLFLAPLVLGAQGVAPVTSHHLQPLQPRLIGPAVTGGRVHDVEALSHDPSTLYVATASGGLWKSCDGYTN